MDWQPIINIGATAVLGIIGWFVKGVKDEMRDTSNSLTEFRIKVANDYVTHSDMAEIRNTLFRIETKLDAKADK